MGGIVANHFSAAGRKDRDRVVHYIVVHRAMTEGVIAELLKRQPSYVIAIEKGGLESEQSSNPGWENI